jgi:mRNA-degrading endonuclease RelE of RelBE toxin-antitoxin system
VAARAYEKLPRTARTRIRKGLEELAAGASKPGRLRGKKVRTIQGATDSFHRLRVGDYRVMYDVIAADRVLLVLGIVHRSDLERWLRSR